MTTRSFPALLLLLAFAALTLAGRPAAAQEVEAVVPPIQPDQPGFATPSSVVGKGFVQIETGVASSHFERLGHRAELLLTPTVLRWGATDRFEARVETTGFNHETSRPPAGPGRETGGMGPVALGGKYSLFEGSDANGNLSMGLLGRIIPPTGSSKFSTQQLGGDFLVLADWNFGPNWTLTPNLGVGLYQDGEGRLFETAVAACSLGFSAGRLSPYIDGAFLSKAGNDAGLSLVLDGGASYALSLDTQVNVSVGGGISGETSPVFFWAFGVSQRFR